MKLLTVMLRVVLTLLLVLVGLKVGTSLGPRLARAGTGVAGVTARGAALSSFSVVGSRVEQPDWGGGRLSFPVGSASGIVDSVRAASGDDSLELRTYAGPAGGVALRRKSDSDYALTLAMPSARQPGRQVLFELPSSGSFRKQLLPGPGDAEAPAADIPLYPGASCRTQVGRGTACFVGFYLTNDSVEAVRSFYVEALGRLGWQRVTAGRPGLVETFAKRNEDRMVVVQLREQDSRTTRIGVVTMASASPARNERK